MLKVENLCFSAVKQGKSYNILNNIDLHVHPGELLVITGANGSGKSTLAKTIMGINQADSGNICLDGRNINSLNINERARAGIGYAFQQPPRFKGMTVRKFIDLSAGEDLSNAECGEILSRVGLRPQSYLDREMDNTLSGGEIKRIEVASVLSRDHKLCIFDEPEAGIDLWSFGMLIKEFENMRDERNTSIIIISHQEKIIQMADRIAVLHEGRIIRSGERIKELL
jgi:Fe-S cluster assembly ATP-binding protein